MKPIYLMVAVAAVVASAACDAKKGNDGATTAAGAGKAVSAPKNGDWTQLVSTTAEGGFLMGNPNASVKLIEFGSMTCPHCAEFEKKGGKPLLDKYVKTGKVSYEFRNFVRDPFDLTASLIARCGGTKSFFPLTRALYADQATWVGKIQQASPQQQQALQAMSPAQQFQSIAKMAGLQQWAAMRGVPSAKSSACLGNETEINRLVQMNSDATTAFPEFPGTPTFIVNGKMLEKTATWEALEPQLKTAMGERG